jgi:hypothetical protein
MLKVRVKMRVVCEVVEFKVMLMILSAYVEIVCLVS